MLLEVRKDHNDVTRVMLRNNYAGADASARYDLSTAAANSYVISSLHNNNGSPYYLFGMGSAVTAAYFDAPQFFWRNTSGVNRFTIANTGKVGIGISAPEMRLDVQTTDVNDGMMLRHSSTGFIKIHANSLGAGAHNPITKSGDAGIVFGGGAAPSSSTFGFVIAPWSNSNSGLRINNEGRVSIGTSESSAGYKLFVEEGIRTRKVKVDQASWPDYVFDKKYKLPSLEEVERFIQLNHHLPGINSAAKIELEGLDLGENQASLLLKIEELTLYIIAQDKISSGQKELLKKQGEQLLQLQQELSSLKQQVYVILNQLSKVPSNSK
jgi:hypothetical protein